MPTPANGQAVSRTRATVFSIVGLITTKPRRQLFPSLNEADTVNGVASPTSPPPTHHFVHYAPLTAPTKGSRRVRFDEDLPTSQSRGN
ncbi:hypothetical protein HAX54_038759 [Datura stramonium]|uniref:Uncharacterized protein n=1 Tax=Datura stramonium TaxID=4076 RepID=A0ABS8VKW5_DATST|nr:hypothetical protein [Datura stramonium]